ncbi:MAG: RNA methyltransferase [Candidatus Dojkabacteria bacterium]|nr:RNA methyltransferase [Candidatus Dojkabacteria bacterium]
MKIKRYQKKFTFSYAFGTYPVIDLIKYHSEDIITIFIKSNVDDSEGVEEVKQLCREKNINLNVSDRSIEKVAIKENTYVMGVFKKYECELDKDSNHLVLVEPRNMGNLGTIIRTMLGFGFKDLVLIGDCADIFDPTVVRSTMGAIFRINFKHFNTIQEYMSEYKDRNIYCFMLNGAKDIRTVEFREPFSIVQGNESKGLDSSFKDIGDSVYIPHSDDIDSLNLAVATSIGLWEVRRRLS